MIFFHGTRFTDSFDGHQTIISLISVFSELQKNKSEATLTEAYVHQALVVGLKQLFGEVSYSIKFIYSEKATKFCETFT